MSKSLFRKKTLGQLQHDTSEELPESGHQMNRVLRVKDLTFMGVAAVIGAGIFSTIGTAAYNGGPGVIFLFIITAITCGFTALCYAEFASRVPVSGSAYTYSYVSFGEIVAWIIGWALILEYAIGNIVVAISWSAYFNNILKSLGLHLPDWLTVGYQTAKIAFDNASAQGQDVQNFIYTKAPQIFGIKLIINLPAFIIIILVTILAYIGINESKKTANFMVWLKLIVLAFVVITGFWVIFSNETFGNWSPFLPNGMKGVLKGVSAVFFAYIGFDAISTTAEECANPQRDIPRAMIYSLIICTMVYVITTLVITGVVNYTELNGVMDPLAYVFKKINMDKIGFLISISAVVAATSVLLIFQIGQPRIWMIMSRDGLLPKKFSSINKRFKTPGFATIVTGLFVGLPVLVIDDLLMTDLTSIGTLFAFVLVCGGVLMLPKINKQKGKFSLPYINGKWVIPVLFILFIWIFKNRILSAVTNFSMDSIDEILFIGFIIIAFIITILSFKKNYSLIPVLGVLCCLYLMIEIPLKSWIVFFGWMGAGLLIYLLYGKRNSRLANSAI